MRKDFVDYQQEGFTEIIILEDDDFLNKSVKLLETSNEISGMFSNDNNTRKELRYYNEVLTILKI